MNLKFNGTKSKDLKKQIKTLKDSFKSPGPEIFTFLLNF